MLEPSPPSAKPAGVVFWFRKDLRLHDALALAHAVACAQRLDTWLLPVYVHDERLQALTPWGFERTGAHRRAWLGMALQDLSEQLAGRGSSLLQAHADPVQWLGQLVQDLGGPLLVCEHIAAPEEEAQVQALRGLGLAVETVFQSTLLAPEGLPFLPENVPDRFTTFRQIIERQGVRATAPTAPLQALPPLPSPAVRQACSTATTSPHALTQGSSAPLDRRAAFPWDQPGFEGGERAALAHLAQYGRRGLPHTYKATRNGLIGVDCSSKWSPWLATGALSARRAWAAIADFETAHGATESTYWLWFELLWRDHFRWLHFKHGKQLYAAKGLTQLPPAPHNQAAFEAWCRGETGHAFVDAGMRELAQTGYLSNRMRQNVASFLIWDLACDWRAGAAWFEACLIDFDVHSNQGNWLYLSGRGTDPRGQRRFNLQLQASTYDPDGEYRRMWAGASS